MGARLTILIPNYNRPQALARLLDSVFKSIDCSDASSDVNVLVLDDFSNPPVDSEVETFLLRENFVFRYQDRKRGNAEVAFLSSLQSIHTEYTWLLGNDDIVSLDSVGHLLRLLASRDLGLIILNPRIYKGYPAQGHVPIRTSSETVRYERAEDLFTDFGFVTSTTTFPCIIFRTEPVERFHRKNDLTQWATVYSHTFTLFSALRDEPALFVSSTLIGFTLNERFQEQEKLERQAPGGVMFYHQSLGLARLMAACSECTGMPVSFFGRCLEDEVDKDVMMVFPTTLGHFLTFFTVEQVIRELENVISGRPSFGHLKPGEFEEIAGVAVQLDDSFITSTFLLLKGLFSSMSVSPEWKVECLRRVQRDLKADACLKYIALSRDPKAGPGPAKLHVPNYTMFNLRGRSADHMGRWTGK